MIAHTTNWDAITAIATSVYVVIVAITLIVILLQLVEFRKNRKLQAALTIFQELQIQKARESRRYIYEQVPESTENLADKVMKDHLIAPEEAIAVFNRVGYLI